VAQESAQNNVLPCFASSSKTSETSTDDKHNRQDDLMLAILQRIEQLNILSTGYSVHVHNKLTE
jgi:hypothetical protein